jgi:hypothetical protein
VSNFAYVKFYDVDFGIQKAGSYRANDQRDMEASGDEGQANC